MRTTPLITALFTTVLWAAPTQRPLPPGVIDSDADFTVLRDHEQEKLFYVLPKRYEVIENSLHPLAKTDTDCASVVEYRKSFYNALLSKQKLLELERQTIEQIAATTDSANQIKKQIRVKEVEKQAIDELEEPSEEDIKKAADLTETIAKLTRTLEAVEKPLAGLDLKKSAILPNIKELEDSIKEFHEELIRPAARAHIRLRLPLADLQTPEFKKRFSLPAGSQVEMAKVIGIQLFPTQDEEASYRDKTQKATEIGVFAPEWSIKPIDFNTANVSKDSPFPNPIPVHIEREVSFENVFSLFSYCSLKDREDTKRLVTPLRISYLLALWSSPLRAEMEKTLATHKRTLDSVAWRKISALERQPTPPAAESVDSGAPSLYSPEGDFQTYSYSVSFVFPEGLNSGSK